MERNEMMQYIPHRGLMLLPDSVLCYNDSVTAVKQIRPDDVLLISVNGNRAYPPCLLIELMAQTALFAADAKGKTTLLTGLKNCQINGFAFAGDCLHVKAVPEYVFQSAGQIHCQILRNTDILAEGKILYCLKEGNIS